MRTVGGAPRATTDLTARARIRDAAIDLFATEGFDVTVRAIAARAGVSAGLITHHFGAKDALRAECDAEVLRRYHSLKSEAVADPGGYLAERLAVPGPAAVLLVYLLRAIHAGGPPARDFLASLLDHTRAIMAESVASGLVRPSRDEEARLRHLTHQTVGAMLVQFVTSPGLTPDEFVASLRAEQQDSVLAVLELYSEGLFTSSAMLDDYLRYLWEPPNGRGPQSPAPDPATA